MKDVVANDNSDKLAENLSIFFFCFFNLQLGGAVGVPLQETIDTNICSVLEAQNGCVGCIMPPMRFHEIANFTICGRAKLYHIV